MCFVEVEEVRVECGFVALRAERSSDLAVRMADTHWSRLSSEARKSLANDRDR